MVSNMHLFVANNIIPNRDWCPYVIMLWCGWCAFSFTFILQWKKENSLKWNRILKCLFNTPIINKQICSSCTDLLNNLQSKHKPSINQNMQFRQKVGLSLNCQCRITYPASHELNRSGQHTLLEWQYRKHWFRRLTTGEIPTALTKLRLPMVLALLAALRFLLISFFGGRWCSFAQMGFSFERLTRPRNTIVTNFFIIALPLLQAWERTAMPCRQEARKQTAVRAFGKVLQRRLGRGKKKNTLAENSAREGGRESWTETNSEREVERWRGWESSLRVAGGGGCRQVPLLEKRSCASGLKLIMGVGWLQLWLKGKSGQYHVGAKHFFSLNVGRKW